MNLDESNFSVLTASLLVTHRCNLRCSYCYDKHSNESMTSAQVVNLANKIHEYALRANKKGLSFVFHGGEPTILGLDYWSKVLEHISSFRLPSEFIFRTNGCISKEMANLLMQHNARFIISLDGPREINIERKYANGRQTFDDVVSSINFILNTGYKAVKLSATIPNDLCYEMPRVYRYLRGLGADDISIGIIDGNVTHSMGINWYIAMLDLCCEFLNDDIKSPPAPAGRLLSFLIMKENINKRGCCQYSNLVIETDGRVVPCPAALDTESNYGNIFTSSVEDIINNELRTNVIEACEKIPDDCLGCIYKRYCYPKCLFADHALSRNQIHKKSVVYCPKRELDTVLNEARKRGLR